MRLSTLRLMRSSSCARLLCAVLLLAETAFAASVKTPDGASWPRFRHGLSQTGVAGTTLPAKLELLWEIELGDQILATAAIVGDDVYIPCLSGELACVDRLTGQKRWSYKTLDPVPDNSFAPGFKSAPTVTADAVYIGDEEGKFHAIDRVTGRQRWTFETQGEIYSSAAVADGRVIFGSYDNSLYCLGETDGKLKWKFETGGYVHCSPAVAEGFTFIAGCDEHLRIINIETGEEAGDLPLQTYLIASPAVVGDRLYVGTYASEVVAVDWKKKDVVWRYNSPQSDMPFHSSAAVTADRVVVGGRDKLLHCIDRATGKKVWTFATRSKVDSSPVIVGNRVFVGSNDGNLYELNLTTGESPWKFNAGKPISASPAIGEGVLVIGSESRDGKVYCFGAK